jgi:hypothetical protein
MMKNSNNDKDKYDDKIKDNNYKLPDIDTVGVSKANV